MSETPVEEPELTILEVTKSALGIPTEESAFDVELLMHINSTFSDLTQLGFGPEDGFRVTKDTLYSEYLGVEEDIDSVKTYVFMRVKMIFDPPDSYVVSGSFKEQIDKFEWRLNVARENKLIAATVPVVVVVEP